MQRVDTVLAEAHAVRGVTFEGGSDVDAEDAASEIAALLKAINNAEAHSAAADAVSKRLEGELAETCLALQAAEEVVPPCAE